MASSYRKVIPSERKKSKSLERPDLVKEKDYPLNFFFFNV